eukprot:COSAG01_NODE_7044_length_3377_cov_315.505186_4_plen_82_part_00
MQRLFLFEVEQRHGSGRGQGDRVGSECLEVSLRPFVHNDAASRYYYLLRTQRYDQTLCTPRETPPTLGLGVQAGACDDLLS